jgi:hypothetical protein
MVDGECAIIFQPDGFARFVVKLAKPTDMVGAHVLHGAAAWMYMNDDNIGYHEYTEGVMREFGG